MKKILGISLGVSSIGWAIIEEHDDLEKNKILGIGVRIVPLTIDEKDEFSKGFSNSKIQKPILHLAIKKGFDSYKQRRAKLKRILQRHGYYPEDFLFRLSATEIYGLRARAATEKVERHELGRILLQLNQRRVHRDFKKEDAVNSSRKVKAEEKSNFDEAQKRYRFIQERGLTIGQYFFQGLLGDPYFQIKNKIFPKEAYIEEYDTIMRWQGLPRELVMEIRNEIIFYHHPEIPDGNLARVCPLAGIARIGPNGIVKWRGPKVAPASSPLAEVCRIWEHISSLRLRSEDNIISYLSLQQKQLLFTLFDSSEKITSKDIASALGIAELAILPNKALAKGIRGNLTRVAIKKILQDKYPELLQFNLYVEDAPLYNVDKKKLSGKGSLNEKSFLYISPTLEKEPLYQLWHTIYAIPHIEECKAVLERKFLLDPLTAKGLAGIDFTRAGFSNKSVHAMRKLIPYLMRGTTYNSACTLAGFNQPPKIVLGGNEGNALIQELPLLPKNALGQPVAEKVLNQMIHLVNSVNREFERIDEIRLELARELLQSKEERSKSYADFRIREFENQKIIEALKDFKVKATRMNILKYRLFLEIQDRVTHSDATCIFCGKLFGFTDAMYGNEINVVSIIPHQLRFDFSRANTVLAHSSCGLQKGELTAYDFMESKSPLELERYITQVKEFYDRQLISYSKYNNLLTPANKLMETDFILRQLQKTRFISQKSVAILSRTCREVHVTTGKITEYLRRIWGWDDVLLRLQSPKFRAENLTKTEERKGPEGSFITEEVIPGWIKRKDHRSRALDALAVACTRQVYIQRLNSLHAKETLDFMISQMPDSRFDPAIIPDRYPEKNCPFSALQVKSAVSNVLVSLQAGKKVETKGLFKFDKDGSFKNEHTDIGGAYAKDGTQVASYAFVEHAENHHLAFYVDQKGSYQTHICAISHAAERKKYGFSIVAENPARMWEKIQNAGLEYPHSFLKQLPAVDWDFKFSIQQNEMFILGLQEQERWELLRNSDYSGISPYLFRVQSFSAFDIIFRHHSDTDTDFTESARIVKNFYRVQSLTSLLKLKPFKVKISYLGKIVMPKSG